MIQHLYTISILHQLREAQVDIPPSISTIYVPGFPNVIVVGGMHVK